MDDDDIRGPIAFQGEPGAYSQEALLRWLGPGCATLPCPTFAGAFDAVRAGHAAAALLPVENSTVGSIHAVYDLLLEHELSVQAEVILPVRHALLAPPDLALAQVRQVLSHPQALDQCAGWLAARGLEPLPVHDTAGAARLLAEHPHPAQAAIASRLAARLYGLQILEQDIQDVRANYTRFWLLAPETLALGRPDKTSVIFATRHAPGALHAALGALASRGINLTRIESRPDRRTPWHYRFYLDFAGDPAAEPVQQALRDLRARTTGLRVLGSYASLVLE